MNRTYYKHYLALCQSRQTLIRENSKDTYYEKHHIIPRSLGGTDHPSNLVMLTPKEHYIAHLLLYNHYKSIGGEPLKKMAFALVSMNATNNPNFKRERIKSSRTYQTIKEAARVAVLGRKVENTVNYKKSKTSAHIEAIRKARLEAPPRSEKSKEKMRQSALSRGDNFTGNYTSITCSHCGKEGQYNAMLRWHLDNCKYRKEVSNA